MTAIEDKEMYDSSKAPNLQRPSPTRHSKVFYHIISEGITETGYLNGIVRNRLLAHDKFIKQISKSGIDKDASDREVMIQIAHDYELYMTTGKNTPRRYVTAVLNQYLDGCKDEYAIVAGKDFNCFVMELCELRDCIVSKYSSDPRYVSDGFVVPSSRFMEAIGEECINTFHIPFSWSPEDTLFTRDSCNGANKICIMFDRDYHPELRTHEMYQRYLTLCKQYGYLPLVSTPQFELWMLMHMYGVDYGKPSFDRYKPHLIRQLQQYDFYSRTAREKFMTRERFDEYYRYNIQHAIESSESNLFSRDPEKLMDHPGTNLGVFFKDVLRGDLD